MLFIASSSLPHFGCSGSLPVGLGTRLQNTLCLFTLNYYSAWYMLEMRGKANIIITCIINSMADLTHHLLTVMSPLWHRAHRWLAVLLVEMEDRVGHGCGRGKGKDKGQGQSCTEHCRSLRWNTLKGTGCWSCQAAHTHSQPIQYLHLKKKSMYVCMKKNYVHV